MVGLASLETRQRVRSMLHTAMGKTIEAALKDPNVIELMVNPDGSLWLEKHKTGRVFSEVVLNPEEVERIIRLVASQLATLCSTSPTSGAPANGARITAIVSGELPETGERFEGQLPPVVLAPCFTIRKPATKIYTLEDYTQAGIITSGQADLLKSAIAHKKNIIVAGGTGSGKTTLVNALLSEVARTGDRVILIEDTRELQCAASDCVQLRTVSDTVTLRDLVRSTMRMRPDRIIVGEVRGGEALDMLKAWNTGHPGGVTTLHANSAKGALYRLEQLIQEVVPSVPRRMIAEAIDIIVYIEGRGNDRKVQTLARVSGLQNGDYYLNALSFTNMDTIEEAS